MARIGRQQFEAGQHVRVHSDPEHGPGPWPAEPRGTILAHPLAEAGEVSIPTDTLQGPRRTYWVEFDEPQFDLDGFGPYSMSEVLDEYIGAED